jgi:SLIT-ROBO Rho GTPase activating protein
MERVDKRLGSHSNVLTKALVPKHKQIGRMNISGRLKLFDGSLEEYLEATGEDISWFYATAFGSSICMAYTIRALSECLDHKSRSATLKSDSNGGKIPWQDASDINSIAGVFKLYLRELREPLFPTIYFDIFMTLAQHDSKQKVVTGIRKFLSTLPRSVVCVMRYLFAFLNHLSEYSDENMMSAYNLAICFGPTLMRAPEDKEQVPYQN